MKARQAFQQRAVEAIADPLLQIALDKNAARRSAVWQPAFDSLPQPDATRARAREIRQDVVQHLDEYLEQFIDRVSANGFQVHIATDSAQACQIAIDIAHSHNASLVAKSKSILSEEIGLNQALESAGITPVETDLGEYIVQLRGEKPTHIISPAVHLRREDVGRTFEEHLGVPYTTDVAEMNAVARSHLRKIFLDAPIGISGVNFGVVETGMICLVENEGNIRMVTTLPPVHIALMGVERLVPSIADLAVMLQVLPRSATGQKISSYVNWINAVRQPGDLEGPQERHLILVDNNRLSLSNSLLSDALLCIRCGACLNVCPVYQEIGGAAYDSPYSGPIGSLITPAFFGTQDFGHLAKASTLCGACVDACPVGIDFPILLQRTRVEHVQQVKQPLWLSLGLKAYAWAATSAARFRWAQRLAAIGAQLMPRQLSWIRWLPAPFSAWTRSRHFPAFARQPFRQRWSHLKPVQARSLPPEKKIPASKAVPEPHSTTLIDQFSSELISLGGEMIRCSREELPKKLYDTLSKMQVTDLLVSSFEFLDIEDLLNYLEVAGIKLIEADLPTDPSARKAKLHDLAAVQVGLTRSIAALADTGSFIQPSGANRSQLASMLPTTHIVIISEADIFATMQDWLQAGGSELASRASSLSIISGPSRTADIEMTLTIGVHGPRRVIVFCID